MLAIFNISSGKNLHNILPHCYSFNSYGEKARYVGGHYHHDKSHLTKHK